MAGRIEGKVAVVTGGCSGIGLATVRRFVEEGARVVVGDIDEQRGHELVGQLGGTDLATFVQVDVTDKEQVDALFRTAKETYGSVDIAFNNAGIRPPEDDSILDTDLEAWRRVQEVNLTSVYLCCKAALPHMLEQGRGLDHQHRVVRRGDGCGHLADLLLGLQGRRAVDVARARRAVRARGRARQRAVPGAGEHARCSRSCSPRTPSGPRAGSCTSRWAGSPSPRRWPTRCCSWPPTSRSFITANTFLVDGGISGAYVTPL